LIDFMSARRLPARDKLTICFAHVAYRMGERFALRNTGLDWFEVRSLEDLKARIEDVDVLLCSGLWRNELIPAARRLAFIQSISAGTDQYSREALRAAGIRVASAQGVNERAVAEHAIALILAMARQIPQARDNQTAKKWRGMIGDISKREDELGGKTLLIVGMGRIGSRLAMLAKAFDMRVIAIRRDPSRGAGPADKVVGEDELPGMLPQADFVALTCPLTPRTENLIDAKALAAMQPSACLVNVARGKVVNEPALIEALEQKRIAGAALDCVWDEPLPAVSPLWSVPNVLITPHTAGETRRYEDNVIDLLLENLERLWRGEAVLKNQFV
jgi:phosphoglycerate dehydrogenase-like enzyme